MPGTRWWHRWAARGRPAGLAAGIRCNVHRLGSWGDGGGRQVAGVGVWNARAARLVGQQHLSMQLRHSCLAALLCHIPQVTQPGYQAFLRYMCPHWESLNMGGGPVPPGDDLAACPRPVLGTYDDHDYVGWSRGLFGLADMRERAGCMQQAGGGDSSHPQMRSSPPKSPEPTAVTGRQQLQPAPAQQAPVQAGALGWGLNCRAAKPSALHGGCM